MLAFRSSTLRLGFQRVAAGLAVLGLVGAAGTAVDTTAAFAEANPAAGLPTTVTTDALPTVQANGIVWAQTIVGNTVYATGEFTSARPAGSAAGVNETARGNLLAYDITTGNLITSFNHSLNGVGRAITSSPDGKRVYVGGKFTAVNGKAHNRIAAFDTATGTLVDSFTASIDNGSVLSLAATNTAVYTGGNFSNVGGKARNKLAAFNSAGAVNTSWSAQTDDGQVAAMVMSPDQSKLVFGGNFTKVNGQPYLSIGAVNAVTGVPVPWASQSATFPIQDTGTSAGITSLSADANQIYLTGYNFAGIDKVYGFEGRAALNPANGNINWISDCHGDSYSAYPIGNVLYSANHSHDCTAIGAYPHNSSSPDISRRALAETTYATGTNVDYDSNNYYSQVGQPSPSLLHWFPTLTTNPASSLPSSGSSQAAWSIVGNAKYISIGGEFKTAEGVNQQGLVRYAINTIAPNKSAPKAYSSTAAASFNATAVGADGTSTVYWPATWDEDNSQLTYKLYRDGGATPILTTTAASWFWNLPAMSFVDKGLVSGSSHSYKLVVSDANGNSTTVSVAKNTGSIAFGNPTAGLEYLGIENGTVNATGWAFDANSSKQAVTIRITVNGIAYERVTQFERTDIASKYPSASKYTGFQTTAPAGSGTNTVCVSAVNIGPGNNADLGCKTVIAAGREPVGAFEAATSPAAGKVKLSGWAFDPSTPTAGLSIATYVNGSFAGQLSTGVARADIKSANPQTSGNTGFDSTINAATGVNNVCLYALNIGDGGWNTDLGCKSVTVAAPATEPTTPAPTMPTVPATGEPVGQLESVTSPSAGKVSISGWAFDPSTPTAATTIAVYVDGASGAQMITNVARPDIKTAYPQTSTNAGFGVTVNATAGAHTICAYAINTGSGGWNTDLGCKSVTVEAATSGPVMPTVPTTGEPVGQFEAAVSTEAGKVKLSGWAFDPSTPTGSVAVYIYVNGSDKAHLTTGTTRTDIQTSYPQTSANQGFDATLPLSAGVNQICAYAINTGSGGWNTDLGCKSVTVG